MTKLSAAQKRKKRREEKLLEEPEALCAEEERGRHVPVSTICPVPAPPHPIPNLPAIVAPSTPYPSAFVVASIPNHPPFDDEPYNWYPPPNRPIFDASTLIFEDDDDLVPQINTIHDADDAPVLPPGHPAANWPAPLCAYIYGPVSHSPPPSWYDDTTDIGNIHTLRYAPPSESTPRDFSALRSSGSAHPWRTIRRRNQRLLLPHRERRPFPHSLPKRPVISSSLPDILAVQDNLPELLQLLPPSTPCPPAATAYGFAKTTLAVACAQMQPRSAFSMEKVFDIVWGPYPDEEDQNFLAELPPDQLIFLCTLAEIVLLEPVFEEFLHPAITLLQMGGSLIAARTRLVSSTARGRAASIALLGRFFEGGDCGWSRSL
ncbi:hypothetical protein C8J57DRAFT_1514486 [Mycena rebaudengoi]|nr:hypothetical protein C8J57DRAFT_1514486 [Mycena rebaudengoi]